jgi:hypothetical protein
LLKIINSFALVGIRVIEFDYDKTDIINFLGTENNWQSYLEICTPTTGGLFKKIDFSQYTGAERLMYRCPDDFCDGLPVSYRSPTLDVRECLANIRSQNKRYQVILVDSWHEYDCSIRDMNMALGLLEDRGVLLVHDCYPPTAELAQEEFRYGGWCGYSFIAFVDLMYKKSKQLDFYTVDTDYGCGIVRKKTVAGRICSSFGMRRKPRETRNLYALWKTQPNNQKYDFLSQFKEQILNLKSVSEFESFERKL